MGYGDRYGALKIPYGLLLSRVVLRPRALAHRPPELPFAAACALALALVFYADVTTPIQVALSALGLIPLLAAMWLLSGGPALVVATLALGQLLATGLLGRLSPVTVASEATAYVVLSVTCRVYAGSLARLLPTRAAAGRRPFTQLDGPGPLTHRELQVAQLAAQGYTAREIGSQLHIGKRTVETHLANSYDKLGIRSKRELIQMSTSGWTRAESTSMGAMDPADRRPHPSPSRPAEADRD
jgi:DNA-binding CsgD family transcriptional regulator